MGDNHQLASFDQQKLFELIESSSRGRFKPISSAGEGGMAQVVKAYDTRLEIYRALKVIKPGLMGKKEAVARFLDEARAMTKIPHPHIVTVYDIIDVEGPGKVEGEMEVLFHYLILEWCSGGTIDHHIQVVGKMPPRQVVTILLQVCEGLRVAHSKGIFHRDIKPENFLLTLEGVPKLSDFGIARIHAADGSRKTQMGVGMGSPGFMPQEQWDKAAEANAAFDIHALGISLWYMITGRYPGEGGHGWYHKFGHEAHYMEGVPVVLVPIIRQATRFMNEDRYQTLDAFTSALRDVFALLPPDPADTVPLGCKASPLDSLPPTKVELMHVSRVEAALKETRSGRPSAAQQDLINHEQPVRVGTLHETNGEMMGRGLAEQLEHFPTPTARGIPRFAMIGIAVAVASIAAAVAISVYKDRPVQGEDATVAVTATARPASTTASAQAVPDVQVAQAPVPSAVAPAQVVEAPPDRPMIEITLDPINLHEPPIPVAKKAVEPLKKPQPKKLEPAPAAIAASVVSVSPPQAVPPPVPVATQNVRVGVNMMDGGSLQVTLSGSSGRYRLPASVPPGTYKIMISDGEDSTTENWNLVVGNAPLTIKCHSTLRCTR